MNKQADKGEWNYILAIVYHRGTCDKQFDHQSEIHKISNITKAKTINDIFLQDHSIS